MFKQRLGIAGAQLHGPRVLLHRCRYLARNSFQHCLVRNRFELVGIDRLSDQIRLCVEHVGAYPSRAIEAHPKYFARVIAWYDDCSGPRSAHEC